jgi:hypothetical protein
MVWIHQASHKEAGSHHSSFSRHYHLLFLNSPYYNTYPIIIPRHYHEVSIPGA